MWSDDLVPYSDYDPDLTHAEALRDDAEPEFDAAADQVQANDETED